MKRNIIRLIWNTVRVASLMILAALGTTLLMRSAPGYLSDVRELDPEYSSTIASELKEQQSQQGKTLTQAVGLALSWLHGDFGRSRQFDVPVLEMIRPRSRTTCKLLFRAVSVGWLIAISLALPLGLHRSGRGETLVTVITVIFLSIPAGALATICLLADCGGPVAVLATLISVRDFKLLYKLIRKSRMALHLSYARAQGLRASRITMIYLLPSLSRELLAIGVVSIIVALSAIVPIEVVFDVPGLGQLAWSAAMNRDLPVLLCITLCMAGAVGLLTTMTKSHGKEVCL